MAGRHSANFHLLINGLLAQGVATPPDPHSLYEHLRGGFVREAVALPTGPGPASPAVK